MSRKFSFFGAAATLSLMAACSANPGGSGNSAGNGGESGSVNAGGNTSQGGGGNNQGGNDNVGGFGNNGPGSGGGQTGNTCGTDHAVDDDGDGFTEEGGDCNDCDANVNPGAIDVIITEPDMDGKIPDPSDEDCDGMTDNVLPPCDDNLALADDDAFHGANAIELCQKATAADKKWGVLNATYVRADGSSGAPPDEKQHGIMDKFGLNVNVQGGKRMLVLSSGHARDANDPDACGSQTCVLNFGNPPSGFPQDVPNCSPASGINDDVALELKLRTPKNATGYSFSFKFQSFEFPEWVCTPYNDQFIALVNPAPPGAINGNISFDSKDNPVSVNIAFFDVCSSCNPWAENCPDFGNVCPPKPVPCCPSGGAELQGTGFDTWGDSGATTWLKTQAPVKGGDEVTIRFAIWDTDDQALDSTVLVDNFQWIANGGTVAIGTIEIPDPQ